MNNTNDPFPFLNTELVLEPPYDPSSNEGMVIGVAVAAVVLVIVIIVIVVILLRRRKR